MMTTPITTVYLVRHGETRGNREGRFQTHDFPLSDEGREQARRLAVRFSGFPVPDLIYTSDILRARETAAILAERVPAPIITTPMLRELDAGDWKGMTRAEVEALHPGDFARWIMTGGISRLPGSQGECVIDVRTRIAAFFRDAVVAHRGRSIVLVSHGWALSILLAELQGWDATEAFRDRKVELGNTALSVVEVGATDDARCILTGCTLHLGPLGGEKPRPQRDAM
jgi:broad specificity phosphatase PhoE